MGATQRGHWRMKMLVECRRNLSPVVKHMSHCDETYTAATHHYYYRLSLTVAFMFSSLYNAKTATGGTEIMPLLWISVLLFTEVLSCLDSVLTFDFGDAVWDQVRRYHYLVGKNRSSYLPTVNSVMSCITLMIFTKAKIQARLSAQHTKRQAPMPL
jgi:hypothetical protein